MPAKIPEPRVCRLSALYCPTSGDPVHVQNTWLENEAFCYPNGGMTRRALCLCPDGVLRVCWAGIPDTYFTIPATARVRGKRIKGYITVDETGFQFNPNKEFAHLFAK